MHKEIAGLRRLGDALTEGRLAELLPDRAGSEAFSAERQTEALVRAFQGMQAPKLSVPGSTKVPAGLQEELDYENLSDK